MLVTGELRAGRVRQTSSTSTDIDDDLLWLFIIIIIIKFYEYCGN